MFEFTVTHKHQPGTESTVSRLGQYLVTFLSITDAVDYAVSVDLMIQASESVAGRVGRSDMVTHPPFIHSEWGL